MSDGMHSHEESLHNQEVEFEREDLGAKPILTFLITLTVGCVLVALVLRGMYSYLSAYENHHQPVQSPLVPPARVETRIVTPGDIARFPQPRLESDERLEINDFRRLEEEKLNSYGWVDQQAGVVRIPIDRAIQLVAQRGLPTRPPTSVAPPSAVKVPKDAAHKSDTSGLPAKPK
jgi:hypothetical protein